MNPYRSKLPAAHIQARLESEVLSSNASLSSNVGGEGRGEGGEEEKKGKSQIVLLNLLLFL